MNTEKPEPPEDLQSRARLMSEDDKLNLIKGAGWIATGHWDNWFHPISGWNYDLRGAVVEVLKNATRTPIPATGGEKGEGWEQVEELRQKGYLPDWAPIPPAAPDAQGEKDAEMLDLQIKSLEIIAEHRGRHGDKTVEEDILGAIKTIITLRAKLTAKDAIIGELDTLAITMGHGRNCSIQIGMRADETRYEVVPCDCGLTKLRAALTRANRHALAFYGVEL